MSLKDAFRISVCLSILLVHLAFTQEASRYQYVFPKPNAQLVSRETNIILRPGKDIEPSSVSSLLIRVEGSQSGLHRGRAILSDDRRTVVFNLSEPLFESEHVNVDVAAGLRATDGTTIGGVSFRFATSISLAASPAVESEPILTVGDANDLRADQQLLLSARDTLPTDFPSIRIDTLNNPAPGNVFLANFGPVGGVGAYGNYLMILDNRGKPVAYKKVSPVATTFAYNFTTQPNGLISYVEKTLTTSTVRVMDTTLTVVDSFQGEMDIPVTLPIFAYCPTAMSFCCCMIGRLST